MNHDKDKAGGIPRTAILGIHLEANGFAPPTVRARKAVTCRPKCRPSMHAWTPVPLIMLAAQPGGPIEQPLLAVVRRVVEPGVPVIVTHDLHCNVSERLVDALDALIASHIDLGWCDNYKKYLFNFAKHRRPEHYGLIVERTGVGASISRKKTP